MVEQVTVPLKTRIENRQVTSRGAEKENKCSTSWLNVYQDYEDEGQEILQSNHQFHKKSEVKIKECLEIEHISETVLVIMRFQGNVRPRELNINKF